MPDLVGSLRSFIASGVLVAAVGCGGGTQSSPSAPISPPAAAPPSKHDNAALTPAGETPTATAGTVPKATIATIKPRYDLNSGFKFIHFEPGRTRVMTRATFPHRVQVVDPLSRTPVGKPIIDGIGQMFAPDGKTLVATNDNTVRLWDVETGSPTSAPLTHDVTITAVAFSPDGKRLAAGGDNSTVVAWQMDSGQRTPAPIVGKSLHNVNAMSFSPDGTKLAVAAGSEARVYDATTGAPLSPPLKHAGKIFSVQFDIASGRVVTASEDKTAKVWDAATGQVVGAALSHEAAVSHAVFSPDGEQVATTSRDQTARVWKAASGEPVTQPLKHSSAVHYVAFDADGKRIATACYDGVGGVWNVAAGTKAAFLENSNGDLLTRVCFSPDGRFVASFISDGVIICDAETGKQVHRLRQKP